jgi:tRNA(Ile)-lysidine synthase
MKDCPAGAVFLVAVSGGADSMALLSAVSGIVPKERLFCLHVEHGLRPAGESKGDAEFVRDFCEKRGIKCRVESIPPGKIASFARRKGTGIEAAARRFRRRSLFKEAARLSRESGCETRILIAHTKDDLLETALMRVLRGAGSAGLAAMPVNRGKILRPLLSVSRRDVIAYLTENNIPWREDSTNTDEKFLRNRIRRKLVPLLDALFPSWRSGLFGMAQTQALTADFLASEAKRLVKWGIGSREQGAGKDCLFTDLKNFFAQPLIIREESVFHGLNLLNSSSVPLCLCARSSCETRPVRRSVIRKFCRGAVLAADLGAFRIRQQQNEGKIVIFPAKKSPSETGFSLLIKEPGLYNLNNISIEVAENKGNEGFLAALPLVFRRSVTDGHVKDEVTESAGEKVFRVIIRGTDV